MCAVFALGMLIALCSIMVASFQSSVLAKPMQSPKTQTVLGYLKLFGVGIKSWSVHTVRDSLKGELVAWTSALITCVACVGITLIMCCVLA